MYHGLTWVVSRSAQRVLVSSDLDRKGTIHEITLKEDEKFGDISCCFVDRLMPAPYTSSMEK